MKRDHSSVFTRDVKSCQIRHPEVRMRYPDTSEGSHRIASYIWDHVCMVYLRPYCSISDQIIASMLFLTIMARPPQLHRNETFCKLKIYIYLHAYHQRFDLKIVIFTARKLAAYCIHVDVFRFSSYLVFQVAISKEVVLRGCPGWSLLPCDQTSKLFVLLWRGKYHCILKMCE